MEWTFCMSRLFYLLLFCQTSNGQKKHQIPRLRENKAKSGWAAAHTNAIFYMKHGWSFPGLYSSMSTQTEAGKVVTSKISKAFAGIPSPLWPSNQAENGDPIKEHTNLMGNVLAVFSRVGQEDGYQFPMCVQERKLVSTSLSDSGEDFSEPAPDWESTAVIDGEFKQLRLSDYRGKYLVLLFYPLDFTFVCPTELIAFNERVDEFRAAGAEVVGCSTDSQFTHLAWINTPRKQGGLGPMRIPLLSDLTHQMSWDYGVFVEEKGHALRGLFIIDGRGILRQVTLNDLPVGRSVDESLRLVQALRYTDEHGTVCPAGWKPGDDTINPEEALRSRWSKQEL